MKALQYDWVQQHRSTWGDVYDEDRFATTTEVYDQFNATHIRKRFASAQRDAMDKGDEFINSSSGVQYYSVAWPLWVFPVSQISTTTLDTVYRNNNKMS